MLLFFAVAGEPPPGINEAHYFAKAKHYWNPQWLANDLFVASRDAHTVFFATFGWLTCIFDLSTSVWITRLVGWTFLATGLFRFTWHLFQAKYAALSVAVIWIVLTKHGNLAGEWVVGGVESKVFAYGFLLFALREMMTGRWGAVWILLGLASAFHVLVGGWSVLIAMAVRGLTSQRSFAARTLAQHPLSGSHLLLSSSRMGRELSCLLLGGAISLFGLLPSLSLGAGVAPRDVDIAAHLYVYGRISHHLNPASFAIDWYIRHGVLVGVTCLTSWYYYSRLDSTRRADYRTFYAFAIGAIALGLIGLTLAILPAIQPTLGAKLLRFYWFRMSDAIIPLAAAVTVTGLLRLPSNDTVHSTGSPSKLPKWVTLLAAVTLVACFIKLAGDSIPMLQRRIPASVQPMFRVLDAEGRPTVAWSDQQVQDQWLALTDWIRQTTADDALFLTPRHQQTFKWYAQRAEFVNWKDVPQDARSLIEWARRFNLGFPQVESRRHPPANLQVLTELAAKHDIDYLVVDRRVFSKRLNLPIVYPSENHDSHLFWVYRFQTSPEL